MRIIACYNKTGPQYHRILAPVHFMMEQDRENVEVIVKYKLEDADFDGVDIVFFNRAVDTISLEDMLAFKAKWGFKMICDLDDHWRLGRDHVLYHNYARFGLSKIIESWIVASDAVTVTHERLADQVEQVTDKPVYVLPNAIPQDDQFMLRKTIERKVRLFWAGGVTHRTDLELLRKPFKLLDKTNIKFIIGGYSDGPGKEEWGAMANMYTNHGRWDSQVIKAMGVHEYYKVYALCDIALIPLLDNHFNSFKSNLKILEAANIGAPVVVSQVHPYLDFPSGLVNYVDGLNRTWYSEITKLVKDADLRREQGAELRNYCFEHYNFDRINQKRKEIFYDTIGHRLSGIVETEVSRMGNG